MGKINAMRRGVSLAVLVAATGGSGAAWAQTERGLVDEVVVTANKREESLREVPASVSALSAEQLERTSAAALADFASYIPGLQVDTSGPPGLGKITLRGITVGTIDSTTVGTYVDDVPLGSSSTYLNAGAFTLDLMPYDIARVEVLRGPQGTLYGASTMGGLLKYVTQDPEMGRFEARAGADVSQTRHAEKPNWDLRAGVNAPLIEDRLALRASAFYSRRAGYIDNAATGETDVNSGVQKGGRVALLFTPTDNVELKLSAMLQKTDYDASAAIAYDPSLQAPVFGYLKASRLRPESFRRKQQLYTGVLNWGLGWADLTSATSYSKMSSAVTSDATASLGPLLAAILGLPSSPLVGFSTPTHLEKLTQEVRLASPSGGRLEWLVGAFYTDEDARLAQVGYAYDTATGEPLPTPINPLLDASIPSTYKEFAVFGNATYKLTEALDVSGGLRWARNEQRFNQMLDGLLTGGPSSGGGKSTDEVVTYMLSSRYRVNDDLMFYGRVATSYRPGGPNIAVLGISPSFGPDTLTNYEIGVRSSWAENRLTLDLTAFYIDWRDIQISVCNSNSICAPDNGGSARSQGLEFTSTLRPAQGVRIGVTGAYTDAKLEKLRAGANIPGAAPGARLPLAPKFSGSVTADYEWPLSASLSGEAGVGLRFVGDRNSTFAADPENVRLKAYAALDAHLGVVADKWKVSLFGRNLTDEHALVSAGSTTATILEPRTVGVSLETRF